MYAEGDITIDGGTIETDVASGKVNYGIYASKGSVIINDGTIEAVAGDVNGMDSTAISSGIYAKTVTINGGKVTARSGKGGSNSYGIYGTNGVSIKNGTVTATSGEARTTSFAIYSSSDSVTITDSKVTVQGGSGPTSGGVRVPYGKRLDISGGTVEAYGGNESKSSYGFYCNGSTTVSFANNCTATVSGGFACMGVKSIKVDDGLDVYYGDSSETKQRHTTADFEALSTKPRYLEIKKAEEISPVEDTPAEGSASGDTAPAEVPAATETVVPPAPAARQPSGMILATMVSAGKKALRVHWTPAQGVDGYDVFIKRCHRKRAYKLAASVQGNEATLDGLAKYSKYTAYVRAWVMENGAKRYVLDASPKIHAITGGVAKDGTVNPRSLTLKKSSITLKTGKTAVIKGTVKGVKKGRVIRHAKKLRFISGDPAVARVSAKGKVKGVGAGSCLIYVYTNNGIYKTVKVTVE